jgi:GH25 family lysozyme M1 (1,4-beta-N-acetylmuramidase)
MRGVRRSIGALVATAAVLAAMATPAGAARRDADLPGIDVSHWQGTIDWSAVAATGQRFVFAKASEGQTYDDPMYAANRAGAGANGILFGAYHFAQPDTSTNDAVIEADHFADVAAPVRGDLYPVLDIEASNGLSVEALTTWVHDWLVEATARIGVKPLIYTNPSFWRTNMGDTQSFAKAGYKLLWIANWDVPTPDVPANDWAGHGWTFWQNTDCATVNGIAGCVDGDLYRYQTFRRVRIGG